MTAKPVRNDQFAVGIIDTMIGFQTDPQKLYAGMRASLRDRQSREDFLMPAEYMFRDVPAHEFDARADAISLTLTEMDRHGVEVGLISASVDAVLVDRALSSHPDRFVASYTYNPNKGMDGIRALVRAYERWGIRAVSIFPHGPVPQVPINAPLMYVCYAKCVELGLPVFCTVGISGPRVPSNVQHVALVDEVMYDFPDLVFVMRHGGQPWVDMAIQLLLKWPNLYYSTSAFSPRYYPQEIIEFANTRGADKVIYGGYFPMGLTLERITSELPGVPFRAEVWPKFLRDNAAKVLKWEIS